MNAIRKPSLPNVALVLGLALAAWFLTDLAVHWSYYRLPPVERPLNSHHGVLRPSGRNGLVFALIGTTAMLLNLTYLARKRLGDTAWLGTLKSWMRFHVLTGLAGPALILLHTAFAPTSALGGLAVAAMLVVAVTGVVGRYIYTHVPRTYRGRELELGEVRGRLANYRDELEALGAGPADLKFEPGPESEPWQVRGLLPAVGSLLAGDQEARRQFRQLQQRILEIRVPCAETTEILGLLRKLCRERQWLLRYHELRSLMGSWRFFHRWLAVVLFLVVAFHVALALRFGDLWILNGG